MAIKAAFFDIDGTLVSFKTHQIPASTIKAIEQAPSDILLMDISPLMVHVPLLAKKISL